MKMDNDFTVIYIAGASRSGSTVIEDCLARRFGGVACGELYRISQFASGKARIVKEVGARETCACGTPVSECAFWRAVSKEAGLDLITTPFRSRLNRRQRALFRLCVMFLGSGLTKRIARRVPVFEKELEVGENCLCIYRAISRIANVNLIVDSSKHAHQYFILKAVAPESLRLVTLLRDGRAVVKSMTKGARGEVLAEKVKARTGRSTDLHDASEEAARAWMVSILNGLLAFVLTKRERRFLLRYEAFCEDPIREMRRIECRFSLSESDQAHASHAIGGSPSRNTSGFEAIRAAPLWESQLLTKKQSALMISMRLLNRFLNYGK